MKVTVTRQERVKREIEVTFPVYRTADYGGDTYSAHAWLRFDEDGTLWEIQHDISPARMKESWEIEKGRWRGSLDFKTDWDLDENPCTRAEFERAKAKALAFIEPA